MHPTEPGAQMALTRQRMFPGTPQGAACHWDNSWSAASKPHPLLKLVSCDQLLQCGIGNLLLLSQLLLLLLNLLQCRPSQQDEAS